MSFGYSVSDFIAGVNLTYQLIHALSKTQSACLEYQEAMQELGAIQQTFLQVSQLKASNLVNQSTLNGASHIILSSIKAIEDFLNRTREYQKRLSSSSPGSLVVDSWCRVGWALYKKEELRTLKETLHVKLAAVNVLLSTASLKSLDSSLRRYEIGSEDSSARDEPQSAPSYSENHLRWRSGVRAPDDGEDPRMDTSLSSSGESPTGSLRSSASTFSNLVATVNSSATSVRNIEETAVASSNVQEADDASKLCAHSAAERREILTKYSSPNGSVRINQDRSTRLEELLVKEAEARAKGREIAESPKTIKFKDAVGRKFSFPFNLCKTWSGMRDLIRQAFLHVEVIGPHVSEGHYDLVGPSGDIILPQVWETVVVPDWMITMHMWPMPEQYTENEAIQADSTSKAGVNLENGSTPERRSTLKSSRSRISNGLRGWMST